MKKKSVEMMALEMAVAHIYGTSDCRYCPSGLWTGESCKSEYPCYPTITNHFLSLAKKEMDKEKK
jgi:hypothetical protein